MPTYKITDTAGRDVAGQRSPGAGKLIELSESQAAHPLRLGHLVPNEGESVNAAAETVAEVPAQEFVQVPAEGLVPTLDGPVPGQETLSLPVERRGDFTGGALEARRRK